MDSDGDIGSVDNGARLRRRLGLAVALESDSSTPAPLPDPYADTCLDETYRADDSLAQLAKATFRKLSSKAGARNWRPTPIQLQSWPLLKAPAPEGTPPKLIAIATTGSGKTLSYALPMIDACAAVRGEQGRRGVHGLVVVPTRELALQVSKVLKKVAKAANKLAGKPDRIVALAVYGGADREEQREALGQASHFVLAATPLRLLDLLGLGDDDDAGAPSDSHERVRCLFEATRYLVIDEADQMAGKADMSRQVDRILEFVRARSARLERECLFSATLPRRAAAKCHEWIARPRVTVKADAVTVGDAAEDAAGDGPGEAAAGERADEARERAGPVELATIPAHITQTLHVCAQHKKVKKLMTTLQKLRKDEKARGNGRRKGLVIIFFGRIKTLQYVHGLLQKEQIQGVALHSQMRQETREAQLLLFRCGKCPILLATDVAARGVHINNVDYVINYDFPGSLEQYVHRCGRAGRSQVSGHRGDDNTEPQTATATVYSFFHRELAPMAKDVVELLRSCKAWVDPNLLALAPDGAPPGGGDAKRKRRKRGKTPSADTGEGTAPAPKKTKTAVAEEGGSDVEDDEFPNLAPNRIVLKRASHVPFSDSDDDDTS